MIDWLLRRITCLLFNHPPLTSFAWGGRVEQTAERTTNLLAQQGASVTVNCCCGRKMVSPIWRPWWRKTR